MSNSRPKVFGVFLFLLVAMAAFSSPGTINDYYKASNDQLLVLPTRNLEPGMAKKVVEKGKQLIDFLKQFGPANFVLDVDFSPEKHAQGKVVILFGTEETNAYLLKNKASLKVKNEKNSIEFYGLEWKGKNNWGIFINQFPEGKYLVFYLPRLDELEKVFDVNHGNTSFCIFSGDYPIGNMALLAQGNFTSESGGWEIEKLSLSEFTPADSYLFIIRKRVDDQNLRVGDVILEIDGKELLLSNHKAVLGEFEKLEPQGEHEVLILRNGEKIRVSVVNKTIAELDFNVCCKNIPQIGSNLFVSEAKKLIAFYEEAYVDSFNYLETDRFQKACAEFTSAGNQDSISLIDVYKKLCRFAASFNDGHIYINNYNLFELLTSELLLKNRKIFPFQPIISNGKLFVPENNLGLTVGAEIVGIGNRKSAEILNEMALVQCGETFAHKLSGFAKEDFSYFFYFTFGEKQAFSLQLKSNGSLITKDVPAVEFWNSENTVRRNANNYLKMLAKDTLYMKLDTFQEGDEFTKMLKELTQKVKEKSLKALILDIRENGGGNSILLEQLLFQISSTPFRVYNGGRVKKSQLAEIVGGARFEENMKYGERRAYKYSDIQQGDSSAFKGRIYLLIGPKTFSTAFDCASVLKEMKRATLIGEPCGGRMIQTGNHFSVSLFKHNITVTIPYKDFLPWGERFKDFGYSKPNEVIKPDYFAPETETSIATKSDPCLAVVEKLEKESAKKQKFDKLHTR